MNKLQTKKDIRDYCKEIDLNIGNEIDKIRKQKLITMSEIAKYLGVSTQQVQKYLKGMNRIPIGRLIVFSIYLKCDVTYFIKDYIKNNSHIQPLNPFKNTDKLNNNQINMINNLIKSIIANN